MADAPKNIIEFHYRSTDEIPSPFPATKSIPDWMKKMAVHIPPERTLGVQTNTVKKCMPFLEAMTCGYAIPVSRDIRFFRRDRDHLDFETTEPILSTQYPAQIAGSPMAGQLIVKFINKWVVKTPPGYSTLFLPMLNHFTMPFHILAGLVETDVFYSQIHFPAICMMNPGDRFFLARGTPIVQAIPIQRESWEAELRVWDQPRYEAMDAELIANPHSYVEKYWTKKDYR